MLARVGLACAFVVFLFSGCDRLSHLHQQDSKIEKATRAIEAAQTDAERRWNKDQ